MSPSAPEPRTSPIAGAAVSTATVRYWAAARAAAGTDSETVAGATVREVVDAAVVAHPDLARVAAVATFLLDGRAVGRDEPVPDGGTVEVLPPFAGG
ncbi:MoaD/ThiS family protein [Terrabacter aerolatus]|uniref:Thiamine biosynthesis protein ThiS n=1 Tax=Terrabacter aerolatus TaxID=422442 RepID=A0A512D099_9MICO|nr:MoaD/ThiS family protein [Terrabacter aerolatus]GEO29886.1 thiamine biosynthesis protein ThiS [Terrabacter aerolatus]